MFNSFLNNHCLWFHRGSRGWKSAGTVACSPAPYSPHLTLTKQIECVQCLDLKAPANPAAEPCIKAWQIVCLAHSDWYETFIIYRIHARDSICIANSSVIWESPFTQMGLRLITDVSNLLCRLRSIIDSMAEREDLYMSFSKGVAEHCWEVPASSCCEFWSITATQMQSYCFILVYLVCPFILPT